MLQLFLTFEFEKVRKYFRSKTLAKSITTALFVLVFTLIGVGIYHFFVSSFRYINFQTEPEIIHALQLFLYEVFLLVLFGITIFSSAISGIFNLYRGRYDNWLISSPGYSVLPKVVFMRALFTSLLPAVVLFLPATMALQKIYNFGVYELSFILISILLFLIIVNAFTLLALLIITYVYYLFTKIIPFIRFSFTGLVVLLLASTIATVAWAWRAFSKIDLYALFKTDFAHNPIGLDVVSEHFRLLPTHPLAMEIMNWQNNLQNEAIQNVLVLLLIASASTILWTVFSFLFYPLWQKFQEGSSTPPSELGKSSLTRIVYHFNGSSTMALFKKELLISSRNWKGILWFSFLSLLWILQIGANILFGNNLQKYDAFGDLGAERIINLQIFQYIIAIYFISSFTLRFVFPSFSVERKASWILGSAPLSFRKIFFGKYLFYTIFFVLVGICMNVVSNNVLHLSFTHATYSMLLFVSTVIFIVTLGMTLGAVFPNTETDDAEAITTSMPGLFFTAIALLFGALSDAVLYFTLTEKTVTPILLFIAVTFLLVIFFLLKTPRWSKYRAY